MQSSRKRIPDQADLLLSEDWERVAQMLPADLPESAKACRALLRCRGIQHAQDLLRLAFAYALADWSLRLLGIWATLLGLCSLSDVALFKRLRGCQRWLGVLLVQLLQRRGVHLQALAQTRVVLVDASVISQPGSQGTDWRVHLGLDLGSLCIEQVQVSDAHGGESLSRFPSGPQVILVADSAYARHSSLVTPLQLGSRFIVREQWNTMPVFQAGGQPFDIIAWLQTSFPAGTSQAQEVSVWLPTPAGFQPVRLIARPLPPEQAEQARRKARAASRKKGHQPSQKNLFAVGFVVLVTNLDLQHWSAQEVLEVYGWRWQIELYFKRLKGLLRLDGLRSRDAGLAQTYLLAKLIAAVLIDELRTGGQLLLPAWEGSDPRPVSLWRLDAWLIGCLCQWVVGDLPSAEQVEHMAPRLQRYLVDRHKNRPQQLAQLRTRLALLGVC